MENNGKKKVLLGMTSDELKTAVKALGMPQFTAGQIVKWLYQQHVRSIDEMTNISKVNRERLKEQFVVGAMSPIDSQRSVDGTVKYLFPVRCSEQGDDAEVPTLYVESVYIPDGDRATLCVSCQVGCKMNCLFCQTGKQGFEGSLSTGDILNQIYALPERETLTNVVFMGQGEPMDNLDAVLKATQILTSADGYAYFTHQRRCSFEYICFGGLNDTTMHAREIVKLLEGLECRVNLIRFHEIPGVDLPGADEKRMEALRDYLTNHGVFTTIRASRGQDIFAACGLLSTAKKNHEI